MKIRGLAFISAAASLALAACAGGGTPLGGGFAASGGALVPQARAASLTVTALNGSQRLVGADVSIYKAKLDGCPFCQPVRVGPILAKGKTAKNGQVSLRGNWSPGDFVCADGAYIASPSRKLLAQDCSNESRATVSLQFK
jgi:hypothetical protein